MAGRKIRNARDAHESLAAAAASGLTRAEWARQEGIDGRSLNAWRMNLERRRRPRPDLRLVELVSTTPASNASSLRVRCGEFVVEVDAGFDDDALARVLAVVASC